MNNTPTSVLMVAIALTPLAAYAQAVVQPDNGSQTFQPSEPFVLGPFTDHGPVVVHADFSLKDINSIYDEAETIEFTGVLTLKWHDPRQAFDPETAGVSEKVYQGNYQFNELSLCWFPQVILVNESGLYENHGIVLRTTPDGHQILISTVNAAAKVRFDMRRFPFDTHRLDIEFEVLGFDRDDVVLQPNSEAKGSSERMVRIPQWSVAGINLSTRVRPANHAGQREVASSLIVSVDVHRKAFFIVRLVVIPLSVIVLLSFSVFWMDQSSVGDRINVSFIGILTGVAYQIVMSDHLPQLSYVTLINGFLNLSFFTMCATVVINLVVGALDKQGRPEIGNRIDRRCRWMFPVSYFGLNLLMLIVAFVFFD